jgi:hypothetical protein
VSKSWGTANGSAAAEAPAPRMLLETGGTRHEETAMITLCIRYTLAANKLADFEAYAKGLAKPVERSGGTMAGYYLPTMMAGPTNVAIGLIDFPSLAAYEEYRARLASDPDAAENLRRAERAGCILIEDRSILRRVETAG